MVLRTRFPTFCNCCEEEPVELKNKFEKFYHKKTMAARNNKRKADELEKFDFSPMGKELLKQLKKGGDIIYFNVSNIFLIFLFLRLRNHSL